jgi:NAD(P)-dependent dehydrogenase (short-subunit alcohol dehydrogenase family)
VDHVHAGSICALTNQPDARETVGAVLGEEVGFVPYVRPGFALARLSADAAVGRNALVLEHHGLVTWGDTGEESLALTSELEARADAFVGAQVRARARARPRAQGTEFLSAADREHVLATLRGLLSREARVILSVDAAQRDLAARSDVAQIASARSTPDHILRIGTRTAVAPPADLEGALQRFAAEKTRLYEQHAHELAGRPAQRSRLPSSLLIPGVGCVTAGANARDAAVRRDLAAESHAVTAATLDAFGELCWLDPVEELDFEYWPLELEKLTASGPPPELEGRVAIVTGAASGIGLAAAQELHRRGAHIVAADIDSAALFAATAALDSDRVVAVAGDVAEQACVDAVVTAAMESFGGIDAMVLNAGVATFGPLKTLSDAEWDRALRINATAQFLLTRRAWPIFEAQGIGASLVFVASKNAFAPGAEFGAYSVSKAAQVQLARITALEGGPIGVRANIVNPDAVFDGSHLWSPELRQARAAAHGLPEAELESFYASRSLLGAPVRATDVAEAIAFLVSDRSRVTTGAVLTVDGGVAAAFPR